jgi:hypothetical protein
MSDEVSIVITLPFKVVEITMAIRLKNAGG